MPKIFKSRPLNRLKTSPIIWALLYLAGGVGSILQPLPVQAASCPEVEFIFARGSGEPMTGSNEQAWRQAIQQSLRGTSVKYSFYELGTKSAGGYLYPSAGIIGNLHNISTLLGAAVGSGDYFEFGKSVNQGVGELKWHTYEVSRTCPQTQFVLGGYSQGAMVISKSLKELNSSKIIYAATFGDPKLYLPEGKHGWLGVPDACKGKNLSEYREYVPDCYTYEGVLGSYQPYQPQGFSGKLGTWCHNGDIMCSSKMSISDHVAYISEDLYTSAATVIKPKVLRATKKTVSPTAPNGLHQVVFLVDSTGSMSSYIWSAQDEAKRLALEVIRNDGEIALFEYRDEGSKFVNRKLCDFTCTEQEFLTNLQGIRPESDEGGDEPEAVLSSIQTIYNTLKWKPNASKSIVVLTDAFYHDPDFDGTTLSDVIQRSLEIDPVNIYVSTMSNWEKENYRELTEQSSGAVIDFASFLNKDVERIIQRPVAQLSSTEYFGHVGDTLYFDASGSSALDGGTLTYEWDLDGDGEFDPETNTVTASHQYTAPFDGYIQVRVTDQNGYRNTMSAHLEITDQLEPTPVKITDLRTEKLDDTTYKVQFSTNATQVLLVSEDVPKGLVELNSGQGEINLENIAYETEFRLVPYTSDGIKGEAVNFTVGEGKNPEMIENFSAKDGAILDGDDDPGDQNQSGDDITDPNLADPNQNPDTSGDDSNQNLPGATTPPAKVPSVPNTGVISRPKKSREV